jgi:prepilin-type N-terminal cleavage/methylation domain-containing protein
MKREFITTSSADSVPSVREWWLDQRARRERRLGFSSTQPARGGLGFTLIEMLVCIAIMAVMMAMVLPAIQNARESARATYCRSNLAQLGEAFHAYHMTHQSLPSGSVDLQSPAAPGPDRFVWGWALQLLPQLDEQTLMSRLDASRGVDDPVNRAIIEQAPEFLTCPSSSRETPIGYAGCHHDVLAPIQSDNNGILTLNSHVRFDELVDGLHQTILLGEAADVRWAEGTSGSLRNFGLGYGEAYVKTYFRVTPEGEDERQRTLKNTIREEQGLAPNAMNSEEESGAELDGSPDDSAPDSEMNDDLQNAISPKNAEENHEPANPTDVDSNPPGVSDPPAPPNISEQSAKQYRETGFWPIHRDSGNFLLVDGSVRSISRSVHLEILRRLANRHDHQPVGDF